MRALAALLMRRRTNAITAAAVAGALSLLLPPLSYVSGAIVGLATLKQGLREGALVVVGALVLCALFSMLMVGTPTPAFAFALMSWVPMWLVAGVLLTLRSQAWALLAATAIGVLAVLLVHLVLDDPAAWWRAAMAEVLTPMVGSGADGGASGEAAANLDRVLDGWAPRMTRFFGAATVVGLMATLVLARWWHASLDNPGGFGREFRALRLPRQALLAALVLGAATLLVPGLSHGLLADLVGPLMAMLLFQGLAVVHGVVHARKASVGWLVAVYVLALLPPHFAVPALIVAGLLDGWMDFRARARAKA